MAAATAAATSLPVAPTMLPTSAAPDSPATIQAQTVAGQDNANLDFDLNLENPTSATRDAFIVGNKALPPLPQKLTPSQAARLAEILDFLHHGLTMATDNIQAKDDGTQVTLGFGDWQKILAVQMLLARYLRAIAEPDTMGD